MAVPHLLFVLDEFSYIKGGVYNIQNGIIKLIRILRCHVKISCLTCSRPTHIDDATIQCIHPLAERSEHKPWSLDHLVHNCSELFSDETLGEKLSNVTHIILFAYDSTTVGEDRNSLDHQQVGTLGCVSVDGLVSRVKRYSQDARVILINNLNLGETSLAKLVDEVDDVYNVGFKLHSQNDNQLQNKGKGSFLLLPVFYNSMAEGKYFIDPKGHYIIVTLVSKRTLNTDFLQKCQTCISAIRKEFRQSGHVNKTISWKIYYSSGCEKDKLEEAEVQEEFSEEARHQLKAASLCLVHGDFDTDIHSGLELLLYGIPTLSMKDTDTFCTAALVSIARAKYFQLDDNNWDIKVKELIENGEQSLSEANSFSREYLEHLKVRNSLGKLLRICKYEKKLEEIPTEPESDEIIPSPTPDILQIWHPASTPLGPSDNGEETKPKVPYYSISAGGAENIESDLGKALDLHSIQLVVPDGTRYPSPKLVYAKSEHLFLPERGHIEADGKDELQKVAQSSTSSKSGDIAVVKHKVSSSKPHSRKEMDSQGDSDGKSSGSDDAVETLPPSTSKMPVSSKSKSSGHKSKSSDSLFTTTRYPKSDFERKMRKIKKEANKAVKSKKSSKDK